MIKKSYITGYKMDSIQPLQSGCFHYKINVVDVWFFGLFKSTRIANMEMPYECDSNSYYALWDELIKTKKYINV